MVLTRNSQCVLFDLSVTGTMHGKKCKLLFVMFEVIVSIIDGMREALYPRNYCCSEMYCNHSIIRVPGGRLYEKIAAVVGPLVCLSVLLTPLVCSKRTGPIQLKFGTHKS